MAGGGHSVNKSTNFIVPAILVVFAVGAFIVFTRGDERPRESTAHQDEPAASSSRNGASDNKESGPTGVLSLPVPAKGTEGGDEATLAYEPNKKLCIIERERFTGRYRMEGSEDWKDGWPTQMGVAELKVRSTGEARNMQHRWIPKTSSCTDPG